MERDACETLLAAVADASRSLFSTFGVHVAPVGPDVFAGSTEISGVVGFAGPALRGTLVLSTNGAILDRVRAFEPSVPAGDWICELANQLMGRLRNMLVPYGVALEPSTPVCLLGMPAQGGLEGEVPLFCRFAEGQMIADVLLSVRLESWRWERSDVCALREGDLQIFE